VDPARTEARELDAGDALAAFRDQFWIPTHGGEREQLYFCGNSLGLQPRRLAEGIERELEAWRELAVAGHFTGPTAWVSCHELLREPLARLVGARPDEVVAMNSLTVNLHLLMASFYAPSRRRRKIVIERQPFPSDRYAVESQIRWHGLDPEQCLVELDGGKRLLDESLVEDYLEEHGAEVALVLWPGVHYGTGQRFDLGRIVRAGHAAGARVGFDLAHAVGNVPLALHESDADFAVWCSYKYLNGGPGAVAGAFVHQRHLGSTELPRLQGWWGADPASRFRMEPEFKPAPGADAWQLSNPPVLALTPVRIALELFDEAGGDRLRRKSLALTGFLERLLRERLAGILDIVTPADPERRGCQLSLRVRAGRTAGRALFEFLEAEGAVGDWREPDVIRVAPVPLYNRFEDCLDLVELVEAWARSARTGVEAEA
jgi:kynureninase